MAKKTQKSSTQKAPALTRRYGSIAEIKQEFFPNAAAEEEAASAGDGDGIYETMMDEFFAPQSQAAQ